MPPETDAPAPQESAKSDDGIMDFDAALAAAEATLEQESGKPEPSGETGPQGQPEPEPEHLRWVKSVQGNVDPDGKINVDRLARQSYELNRQNQKVAQDVARLNRLLSDPKVASVLQQALQPQPQTEQKEKTDEEILDDFVKARIQNAIAEKVAPLEARLQQTYQDHYARGIESTLSELRQQFGQDTNGNYVYDAIAPHIGTAIDSMAVNLGMNRDAMTNMLFDRGLLFETLASTARNLLFPALLQQTLQSKESAERAKVETKKKVKLTPKGTPATAVREDIKIDNWEDALKAAEEELTAQGYTLP